MIEAFEQRNDNLGFDNKSRTKHASELPGIPAPYDNNQSRTSRDPFVNARPLSTTVGPYVVLAIFAIILLWPLCAGRTLYWGDILLYFDPMQRYAQHELRLGRLPLWNPYIMCGQPFVGNPQMSVFYPATVLLLFFPAWCALNIATILHLFLAGAFMYLYLRRWTDQNAPAITGAGVYMGSACMVGRLQFPPMVMAAAYIPLLFVFLDRCVDQSAHRYGLGLAVTVALMVMAAHSQVAYLAFVAATAYVFIRLWHHVADEVAYSTFGRRQSVWLRIRRVIARAAPLAGHVVLGLLMAGIYLLPALQLLRESSREKMSVGQANRFFADAPHLLTLLFPRFSGHPATRDFWARGNAWEPASFVGWVPLALAVYGAVHGAHKKLRSFWTVLGLVGVWLALGSAGGLYWLAFYTVPGLSNFHDPARFLLWTTLTLAVLTATGLDAMRLQNRWYDRWTTVGILICTFGTLAWFGRDWNPTTAPEALQLTPKGAGTIRHTVSTGRVLQAANNALWRHVVTDGYMDYGNGDLPAMQRTTDTLLSNLEMRTGLESASGYEPVPIEYHTAIEGLWRIAQQRREPNAARILSLFDVNLVLLPARWAMLPIKFDAMSPRMLSASPLRLWKTIGSSRRAWITRHTYRVDGKMRSMAVVAGPEFDPQQCTLVSGAAQAYLSQLDTGRSSGTESPAAVVELRRDTPSRIYLSTDAGPTAACLVYSGTAYPGWKAMLDGHKAPLWRVNGGLLGLMLTPGRHRVTFIYSPDTLRVGAYVSLVAVALFVVMISARTVLRDRNFA